MFKVIKLKTRTHTSIDIFHPAAFEFNNFLILCCLIMDQSVWFGH